MKIVKILVVTTLCFFILDLNHHLAPAAEDTIPCALTLENGQKIKGSIPRNFITGMTVIGSGEWINGDQVDKIRKIEKTDKTYEEHTIYNPGSGCGDLHASWRVYRITMADGKIIEAKVLIKIFELKSDYPKCYTAIPITTKEGEKIYPFQAIANECKKVTHKSPDGKDVDCLECNQTCPAVPESIKIISFE